jgi:hypothetical protein
VKGKGEGKHMIPQANFKRLVNKNAIKPEIGGPPWQFFLKTLTPSEMGKNFIYPLLWTPCVSMVRV